MKPCCFGICSESTAFLWEIGVSFFIMLNQSKLNYRLSTKTYLIFKTYNTFTNKIKLIRVSNQLRLIDLSIKKLYSFLQTFKILSDVFSTYCLTIKTKSKQTKYHRDPRVTCEHMIDLSDPLKKRHCCVTR